MRHGRRGRIGRSRPIILCRAGVIEGFLNTLSIACVHRELLLISLRTNLIGIGNFVDTKAQLGIRRDVEVPLTLGDIRGLIACVCQDNDRVNDGPPMARQIRVQRVLQPVIQRTLRYPVK